jgi:hypothetical protein
MRDTAPLDPPTDGRDTRGRFRPGRSGNPAGKKPGTLNHATRLKRLLDGDDFDVVARQLIALAREGHGPSVRFLMERLVPKGRGRTVALDLPGDATRAARGAAIVTAMCAGELSPDEAKTMLAVMASADAIPHQAAAGTAAAGDTGAETPSRDAVAPRPPIRAAVPVTGDRGSEDPGIDLQTTCIPPGRASGRAAPSGAPRGVAAAA